MHGQRPATFNELEALGDRLSRQIKSVRIKAARGVSVYTDLLGTPSTFAESAGKVAKVNSDEDSIEFGYVSHTELTDVGAHDHPIEVIGTPTYDDFQDWLNIIQSAGRISGGEITENAAHNGTIDVAAGTGFIKTSDSPTGTTKSFDWDADTGIALTDNQINYVYMDYNSGAPVIGVTTDRTTLDGRTEFILGKVYREGTTLHILSYGIRLTELAYNEHERLISVRGFERASGGEISETGQRYLTSGAGVFYFGLNKIEASAQDTSGADRFTYWYRDGGGGWTKVTGQQQIDNTHYDDGSGALATLTANRYGVHWVYIHFDSDINVVYGQGNYKLAEAENAVLPDTVPELVSDFGVLAAKIVVQKSGANLLTVKSAYKELFPTTFPPKLGDLTDVNAEMPNDNDVLSWDAGTSRWIAVTGGVSGFIGLSDTPANYAGSAGYFLRVNATPNAVEFRSPAEVLSDLSGQAGAAFSLNSQKITSLADPENAQDGATKLYVDTISPIVLLTNQSSLSQISIRIDMSGSYETFIDWGDGNFSKVSGTGTIYSHNYGATGFYTIRVYGRIGQITRFQVSDGQSTISGNIATFKPCNALTYLRLGSTSTYGDVADLPRGMSGYLRLSATSVSGDIADLPTGLTWDLYLSDTLVSAYTATSWPCNTSNGRIIDLDDLGLTQGECDNILCHLDAKGITGGTLDLTGNSIPSATGLACKTNLEGKGWTVSVDS